MAWLADASHLKQLRALLSSEQQLTNAARCSLEAEVVVVQKLARQHLNLQQSLQALLQMPENVGPSNCRVLCVCPEPSVPPPQLRRFLGDFGALLTILRRQPRALAHLILSGDGIAPTTAVQLLLCFMYRHLWQPAEERGLERLLELPHAPVAASDHQRPLGLRISKFM